MFTRVRACMLAGSPSDLLHQRLQPFRYLHDCSNCYRVERSSSRAGLHPLRNTTFHGAPDFATNRELRLLEQSWTTTTSCGREPTTS